MKNQISHCHRYCATIRMRYNAVRYYQPCFSKNFPENPFNKIHQEQKKPSNQKHLNLTLNLYSWGPQLPPTPTPTWGDKRWALKQIKTTWKNQSKNSHKQLSKKFSKDNYSTQKVLDLSLKQKQQIKTNLHLSKKKIKSMIKTFQTKY
eukprot:TRINITY_DN4089_c1_g4_i2.p1 TRINITY_DN4089_c1_g4~~TRINITY_DN4089_c1_g4_i2.p1  ORF type:complete len:148 (+),score=3.76 TRINITY_DN4089_c1_g4_i2:304-747(+)